VLILGSRSPQVNQVSNPRGLSSPTSDFLGLSHWLLAVLRYQYYRFSGDQVATSHGWANLNRKPDPGDAHPTAKLWRWSLACFEELVQWSGGQIPIREKH